MTTRYGSFPLKTVLHRLTRGRKRDLLRARTRSLSIIYIYIIIYLRKYGTGKDLGDWNFDQFRQRSENPPISRKKAEAGRVGNESLARDNGSGYYCGPNARIPNPEHEP